MRMSILTLTQENNGNVIEISVGDTFFIHLPENPTTGYQWAIDDMTSQNIMLNNSSYASTTATGIGGGGQRIWAFETTRRGVAHLRLKLWRAWEGDSSIADVYTITLQIHD